MATGMDVTDVTEKIKNIVRKHLSDVPGVGGILDTLMDFYDETDVWNELKPKAERLIDEEIDESLYSFLTQELQGLKTVINDYNTAKSQSSANPSYISQKFVTAKGLFDSQMPHYQTPGKQELLLPLFIQMATLRLGLLRDGYLQGGGWGLTPDTLSGLKTEIKASISSYTAYVDGIEQTARRGLSERPARGSFLLTANELFAWEWNWTTLVSEHTDLWAYFDPDVAVPASGHYLKDRVLSLPMIGYGNPSYGIQGRSEGDPPPKLPKVQKIRVWARFNPNTLSGDQPLGIWAIEKLPEGGHADRHDDWFFMGPHEPRPVKDGPLGGWTFRSTVIDVPKIEGYAVRLNERGHNLSVLDFWVEGQKKPITIPNGEYSHESLPENRVPEGWYVCDVWTNREHSFLELWIRKLHL